MFVDGLSLYSHPVGVTLAITAAGLTTLWLTRVTWAYWVDCALAASLGLPRRQKHNIFLKGVYKPVDEEVNTEGLKVIGQVPRSLNGVFARVGPNPYFKPTGDYHLYVVCFFLFTLVRKLQFVASICICSLTLQEAQQQN